jgi:hypothetical protein
VEARQRLRVLQFGAWAADEVLTSAPHRQCVFTVPMAPQRPPASCPSLRPPPGWRWIDAGEKEATWVGRFPETLDDFKTAFLALFTHLDIPPQEVQFFVSRMPGLATNAILAVSGVMAPPCGLWKFDIPEPLRAAQVLDRVRFRLRLPNRILGKRYP